MKKTIIIPLSVAALVLMIVACGCGKSSNLNETWAWKGTTYTSTSCSVQTNTNAGTTSSQTLTAQSGSNSIQVIFYSGLPTISEVDTVEAWGNSATNREVNVNLVAGGNNYQCTGGNGFNATVNVTVSGGVVSVSANAANNVELLNVLSNSVDSSMVTFSITQ
jgi:hypothetical protein